MGRGTNVDMPHAITDIVRPWTRTHLVGVGAHDLVPGLGLQEPDAAREEAGCDKVEEAG